MEMETGTRIGIVAAVLGAAVLAGCADKVPPPTRQMALTAEAVTKAEGAGAYELAPVELRAARDKLAQAQGAMQREEYDQARRLAEQAEVDARLAEVKSRSTKAQRAVDELKESIRVLQEELERKLKP